jgi:hypothetical protein
MGDSIYNNVVVIQGPELKGSLAKFIKFIHDDVFTIGDGKVSLMDKTGPSLYFDGLQTLSQMKEYTSKETKTLVVIDAHGEIYSDGYHCIILGENIAHYTSNVFLEITTALKKPVDIIFTPCRGGAALNETYLLVSGSRIVILSGADEDTFDNSNQISGQFFPNNIKFSLDTYYDWYLLNLDNKQSPVIAEVGGSITDPRASAQKYLGKAITEMAKAYVSNKVTRFCDEDDGDLCSFDNLFERLLGIKHLSELIVYTSTTLLRQIFDEFIYRNNATFNESYYIALKQSPAFYALTKTVIDSLFEKYKFPLSYDLEKVASTENSGSDDAASLDMVMAAFEKQASDYMIIEISMTLFASFNEKYPIPEKPEYGKALLAIKYLDEYCLSNDCLASNTNDNDHL